MDDAATGERDRLPDFPIIGAGKSGNSTPYPHLSQHPTRYPQVPGVPCRHRSHITETLLDLSRWLS